MVQDAVAAWVMSASEIGQSEDGGRAPSLLDRIPLRRLLRLLGQSAHATSSTVLFSVANLATTAAVIRHTTIDLAAGIIALYALESIAVSVLRGFLVQAPLLRHASGGLCPGDISWSVRTVVGAAVVWLIPTAVLAWVQGLPMLWILAVQLWISGLIIADILRYQSAIFGSPKRSFGPMIAYTAVIALLSVTTNQVDVRIFLGLAGAASLLLAVALRRDLLITSNQDANCNFWKRERGFALTQTVETSGFAIIASLTAIAIANISAPSAVAIQVAGSAVVLPVLVVVGGAGVAFTRLVVTRQQQAQSDVMPLVIWMFALVGMLAAAWLIAEQAHVLFEAFFGHAWTLARQVIPWLGLQGLCYTAASYALLHYRPFVRNVTVTKAYIAGVVITQVPVLLVVLLKGVDGLPLGFALSAALQCIFWVSVMTAWAKRYSRH